MRIERNPEFDAQLELATSQKFATSPNHTRQPRQYQTMAIPLPSKLSSAAYHGGLLLKRCDAATSASLIARSCVIDSLITRSSYAAK